jgi:hypothetical protein
LVGFFYFIIIEQQQWRHENGSEQISEQSRARNSKDNGREDGWLAGWLLLVIDSLFFRPSCFSVQMQRLYKYRLARLAAR